MGWEQYAAGEAATSDAHDYHEHCACCARCLDDDEVVTLQWVPEWPWVSTYPDPLCGECHDAVDADMAKEAL
jgi:hypothetical protein